MRNPSRPVAIAAAVFLLPAALGAATCRVTGPISHLEWPADRSFGGAPLGGLSGLAWDTAPGRLLAISDDRGEIAPSRWLELDVTLPPAARGPLAVRPRAVVSRHGDGGRPRARNAADPEAIVLAGDLVWVASEGFRLGGVPPFVHAYHRDGRLAFELLLPPHVLPADGPPRGPRHNFALEGLALSGDGATLYAAFEAALLQDGPTAEFGVPSPTRILLFDLEQRAVTREVLYWTEALPRRPIVPGGPHMSGLVEIAWLTSDRLLALERAFALGAGFSIRLYELDLAPAEDLRARADFAALADPASVRAVAKELLFDFASAPERPRNLEGMALAAAGPDGLRPLLVVSDNNFSATEPTAQFFLLSLDCARPAAAPR